MAADALSRIHPNIQVIDPLICASVAAIRDVTRSVRDRPDSAPDAPPTRPGALRVATDPAWLDAIRNGYRDDKWCVRLRENIGSLGISERDGLLFVGDRLAIPRVTHVREGLFRCAHDAMGHFGFDKSYAFLRDAYYWPHMRRELSLMYIPSCEDCQRNKSRTSKPPGPLHPLPVPDARGDAIAIDFIGKLPADDGFDCIATITDRLGADLRLIPTRTDVTGEDFAVQFFDHWYCENGLPTEIVSDRDKLFVSAFWKALHKLSGVKLKMSTAFHPQSDGSSERTNKTVIQTLRYHVARTQHGWARALPRVRFAIMSAVNASTGFSRFQLHLGRQPRILPPLFQTDVTAADPDSPSAADRAADVIRRIDTDVLEAQDNLAAAKLAQMCAANRGRTDDPAYAVCDLVLLSTFHRRRAYMQRGDNRVAKFMVRFDGPYRIIRAFPDSSAYTLELPPSMHIFPTFHSSLLKPYVQNDDALFPSRAFHPPAPIVTENGVEEQEVEAILDHQRRGRGFRFLVRWKGFPPSHDSWLPGSECRDLAAMDSYLIHQNFGVFLTLLGTLMLCTAF